MKFLLISILLITSQLTKGQSVGIIKSNTSPYPGSVLDVESTSKGVLLPFTNPNNISNPAACMIIYDFSQNVLNIIMPNYMVKCANGTFCPPIGACVAGTCVQF